ncbi:glycosyltransferase family 2 protein [Burkholderia sp. TSV86]|uniref:glycosyltransferase family 2 protein n=1 Tax=Burkholderia sp. TSV86 TaxID=1385594 RepID=UPI0009E81254|nr:glycosyltransferase family A protein [Burkholderia sp. TSV86]
MPIYPRISAIIPAFNAARFIGEAVESILTQTYQDFEVIVVNDGSTDNTAHLLNQFLGDSRVRVITFATNQGEAVATNVAIAAARGTYIARLDADDIALPERLAYQVDVLDHNPHVTLTGGNVNILGQDNRSSVMLADADIKCALLDGGGHFITSTTMWRRCWFMTRNIWWNPALPSARDHRFWIDAMLAGAHFANIDRVIALYRLHETNISRDIGAMRIAVHQNRKLILHAFYPELTEIECNTLLPLIECQQYGVEHLTDIRQLNACIELLRRMHRKTTSYYGENLSTLIIYIQYWYDSACARIEALKAAGSS